MCSSFPKHTGGNGAVQVLGLGLTPLLIYPTPKEPSNAASWVFCVSERTAQQRVSTMSKEPVDGNKHW